jgi:D-tyrosyl-tRNA(Tyr) deacylase
MITIIQRVEQASVVVAGEIVGSIGPGLLALVAIVRQDTEKEVEWTAGKLASLRIFRSEGKHFERDVAQIGGSILLVSNFTVAASTRQGRRPSLDQAVEPAAADRLFTMLIQAVGARGIPVQTGRFGADMKISLVNDGPATFILNSNAP